MEQRFQEMDATTGSGMAVLCACTALFGMGVYAVYSSLGMHKSNLGMLGIGVAICAASVFVINGLYVLRPNQCALFLFFGKYAGSDRSGGLRWANPFYSVTKVDLRTKTLVTPALKVNDERGNPVEVAAMAVWRIDDAAAATFGLQDPEEFLRSSFDSALREIVSEHPYDHADVEDPHEVTLRGDQTKISEKLRALLRRRIDESGGAIAIDACKLTHLAYAPEIANAMLRRQQAEAVVSARKKIVLGAVEMVDEAFRGLEAKGFVLNDQEKGKMVGNLLVVLCSEREAQPVVSAG